MTLRQKSFISTGLALWGLVAVLIVALSWILRQGYRQVEEQAAITDLERVRSALSDDLDKMEITARDWGTWDDLYAYMVDHDEEFRQRNLKGLAVANLKVDMLALIQPSGDLLFGTGFDADEGYQKPVPDGFARVMRDLLNQSPIPAGRGYRGIVLFPEGPALVVTRPIMRREGTGSIRGTLVLGRFLDGDDTRRLSERLRLDATFQRLDTKRLSSEYAEAHNALRGTTSTFIKHQDSRSLLVYSMLPDVKGRNAVLLQVRVPRGIHQQARRTLRFTFIALLLAGASFSVISLLFVERVILARLLRLSKDVRAITHRQDASARVSVSGKDELCLLAQDMNEMLAALEVAQDRQRQSEASLAQARDDLEQRVEERTAALAESNQLLNDRLAYERGLEGCSRALLADAPRTQVMPEALGHLLHTASVSRVYVFENFEHSDDGLCARLTFEVCADGVPPGSGNPLLQHVPYRIVSPHWEQMLRAGQPIQGFRESFKISERHLLRMMGIKSILMLPIWVRRQWVGFIAFDDVQERRVWRDEDVILLQTAAAMIGTYLERKNAQADLDRYRLLAENANDIMWFMNQQGELLDVNEAAVRTYGYTRAEMLRLRSCDLQAPSGPLDRQGDGLDRASRYETLHRHKDGTVFPVEVTTTQVMSIGDEPVSLAIAREISDRKDLEDQLRHQAFHDTLTGLPNRSLFQDRLVHALTRAARQDNRVAILFIDLDRFKMVNDSYGHQAGDDLLVAVAACLASCVRIGDTVARLGGDEFTVLLEDVTDGGEATHLAERILRKLEAPFQVDGHELFISASIGIVVDSHRRASAADMLQQADVAMYEAKSGGRGRYVVFHREMTMEVQERYRLETELRRAVDRDEFRVFYQPIVEMSSRGVIGMEALVRWMHPRLGLIGPDHFIPIQEQIGLIEPLTLWVVREAREQCLAWHDAGYALSVSVNLSPLNLNAEFVECLGTALAETKLAPAWLTMEVTETALMTNPALAIESLQRLDALGVTLSMDDFGTGYSSLSYLRQLPVHEVKIDKSFVIGMEDRESEDGPIVRAIVELAHSMRKRVVAEGVENQSVWNLLDRLGCDSAQGYHIARPMPAEEILGWLAASPWGRKAEGSMTPRANAPVPATGIRNHS